MRASDEDGIDPEQYPAWTALFLLCLSLAVYGLYPSFFQGESAYVKGLSCDYACEVCGHSTCMGSPCMEFITYCPSFIFGPLSKCPDPKEAMVMMSCQCDGPRAIRCGVIMG